MRRRILLISLLFIVLIPVGLIGLMNSENGSRWLLQQVFSKLAAQVSVKSIQGRLLDRISLTEFVYQTDTETVAINNLTFAWRPLALLSGRLKIIDLTVNTLNLTAKSSTDQQESSFNFEDELWLPVELSVDNLLLTDMNLRIDGQIHTLKKLQLSALTRNGQAQIGSLVFEMPEAQATLQGQIGLGKGFPLSLASAWKLNLENNGSWQGSTVINGDLHKLVFNNQLIAPFKLDLQGHLADLLTAPSITARGDWQNLKWPLVGAQPQIQSSQGAFELTGLLDNYHITLNSRLQQQYLPDATLLFDGSGSLEALAIKKLELKSKTGQFQLTGDVSWKDSPAFDLIATGQNFNPAILSPEMPGNLTFNTHVKGKMAAALQLDAEIKQLSGQLRGHPVSANGKLALNDEQLKVDALRIASGPNKLAIDGTLGQQQAALKLVMDMPNLATLWPNMGGNLQGEGQFQGEWKSPTVKLAATGNRLRFAEHSVKQLAINIDYHPETQKNSTIKLTANTIKSGSTELSKLSIEGEGSTVKHQFTVDMRSMQGDLSAALSGSLKTNNWQGAFSELEISSKEAGAWRLKDAMGIRVTQKAPGFDVAIDEGCLTQQAAAICVQGLYAADGNLKFALKTTAIPVRLVKAWLPESVDLTTVINGDAEIQQQKGFLSGRYQFAMPPGIILLKTKDTTKEIALGASSLSGDIKGDVVSGNIDLNLSGQDYLHGQLQMNIGKTQALSGQMSAKVDDFAVLKAFVPQLTDIKGHLLANLTIKGSAKDPAISGQIDLTEGLVDTNQINLRDITIHALALEDNRIQVQGSIAPKFFKPETSEPLAIKGIISIDGEVQQQKSGLDGRYRLTIPTKMSITVKSQEIVLGPSLLSGNINGDLITADLDVRLVDQDYCRGNLQINTGDSQSLSGRFNASIRNFDLLETFVPQLSDIKGQLTADLNVGGTLQKPQVNGSAQLGKGAVDVVNMGVSVRDINFQALASADHPERILIKGGAKSGEGSLKLDGVVDLQAQPNGLADLFLAGENFEVAKIPEAQIAISPALKIVFADGKGKISGTVKVPKALLVLQEIPENAVNVSDDEVIIGQTIDKEKQASSGGIDTDIEIELGKQVNFSGQGLKTDLAGRLKITDAAGKLTMNGNVDLVKASYKRFRQDLTVRKGRFLFNGPADNPWLDVEAIRLSKSKKVTAVLSLTGSLKNPKTLIFSEPALPETEALAYLITGGPLSQVGKSDGGMVASAALSYGTGQASWLAKKFGIDEFNLEEGETLEDSLLAVGQYLTPNFYIGTKVGLFNKQAVLVLKHKINETFNVETQTGSSQRIKLNYEFDTD